jgi:hypothetical protein
MERLSLERVTIFDPGWIAPRTLNVADLGASWAIGEVGRLSFVATDRDALTAAGSAGTLLGRWLIFEHPTCGSWSGYVEDTQTDFETETVAVSCVSLVNLLAYRRTPLAYRAQQMSAGGFLLRAIEASADDDSIWLAEVEIDHSDVLVTYEQQGESILDLMNRLAKDTGEEWLASSDSTGRQTLEWRTRVGTPGIVAQFSEGMDTLGGAIESSISQLVNDLQAVADDERYTLATRTRVVDRPSVLTYGRRQETRRYLGLVAPSSLLAAGTRDLQRSIYPTNVVSLSVSHLDSRLPTVREGSRVLLTAPSVDAAFQARLLGRAVDVLDGTTTLLLEVERQYGTSGVLASSAGTATTEGL